jgi:hypothetical protein
MMMNRRNAMAVLAGGSLSLADAGFGLSAAPKRAVHSTMRLSQHGSGRATAYAEANKIVTVDEKTHVTWLDSVQDGFRVRIRTLDRRSGQWSQTWTVGPAHDNHGGPTLTVDSRGHLHVVYFPHHNPFRYRSSLKPNDASAWSDEVQFGRKLSYPTLVCGPDDTLYLTARRSHARMPWTVEMWKKPVGKAWEMVGTILRSRAGGYSHFQEALAWGPDHKRLHLSVRIYENGGSVEVVGYMFSDDFGKTWRGRNGRVIEQPVSAETIDVIASGGRVEGKSSHKCGTISVTADGQPVIVYSASSSPGAEMIVATPDGKSAWSRHGLASAVAGQWPDWRIGPAAEVSINRQGTMYVLATMASEGKNGVALISSKDLGRTIKLERPAAGVKQAKKWLANLERVTGHHRVDGRPGVIFTAGTRGKGNTDILNNDVFWV